MDQPDHIRHRLELFEELVRHRDRLEFLERVSRSAANEGVGAPGLVEDLRSVRDELAEIEAGFAALAPRMNRSLPWHERRAHADYLDTLIGRARDARGQAQSALLAHETARLELVARAARVTNRLREMTERQSALSGGA
jgi:hypothetical protein